LSEEGIQFVLSAEPVAVQGRSGEGVSLTAGTLAGAQTIEASDILVAIGRIPNTTGIGLDTAGVALDARGYIRVNDLIVMKKGTANGPILLSRTPYDAKDSTARTRSQSITEILPAMDAEFCGRAERREHRAARRGVARKPAAVDDRRVRQLGRRSKTYK